jgi:hypothetical protein
MLGPLTTSVFRNSSEGKIMEAESIRYFFGSLTQKMQLICSKHSKKSPFVLESIGLADHKL